MVYSRYSSEKVSLVAGCRDGQGGHSEGGGDGGGWRGRVGVELEEEWRKEFRVVGVV